MRVKDFGIERKVMPLPNRGVNMRASSILLPVIVGYVLLLPKSVQAAEGVESKSPSPVNATAGDIEGSILGRWMAAGSGCRADSADQSVKNDVQIVSTEYDPVNPKTIKVTFSLPDFRLRPLEQVPDRPKVSSVNYARECALRLNINPPVGKVIRSASAESQVEVSKDKDVKLFVAGALKIGATTLTQQRTQFENPDSFRFRRHPLILIPGRNPTDEIPEIECGEKKIVGVDLTLLTNKTNETALSEAKLHGNGNLTISVDLENCTPKDRPSKEN